MVYKYAYPVCTAALLSCSGATPDTTPDVAQTASWQSRSKIPYRVQEIYPTAHQGRIYLAGGLSPDVEPESRSVSNRMYVYDPVEDAWAPGASLPEPRHHPVLVSTGDRLFALGGFVATANGRWRASKDILRLDEASNQWSKVAELLHPQSEPVGAFIDGKIYLVSGRAPNGAANDVWNDHGDIDSMQVFDPVSNVVMAGVSAPTARNSAAGAVVDGKLFVVGGRVVNGGNRASNEVFDPEAGAWRTLAPMPNAQGGLAAAALDDRLYVFGGEFFGAGGGGVYGECWVYDPKTDAWASVTAMPVPRHGLGAVTIGSEIFVIGGASRAGANGTSDRVSAFRPN